MLAECAPREKLSKRPNDERLKAFGCDARLHNPSKGKLGDRALPVGMMRCADHSKACRGWDAAFDESRFLFSDDQREPEISGAHKADDESPGEEIPRRPGRKSTEAASWDAVSEIVDSGSPDEPRCPRSPRAQEKLYGPGDGFAGGARGAESLQ